jgi:hypothetical protein
LILYWLILHNNYFLNYNFIFNNAIYYYTLIHYSRYMPAVAYIVQLNIPDTIGSQVPNYLSWCFILN